MGFFDRFSRRKYELTYDDRVAADGGLLRRIRATRSFGDVKRGDLGGFIENEYNLSHRGNCWIYDDASVGWQARVSGDARVGGRAEISGHAEITGNARVGDRAQVGEWAIMEGDARALEGAKVYGGARLGGKVCVRGQVNVGGDTHLSGDMVLDGAGWTERGRADPSGPEEPDRYQPSEQYLNRRAAGKQADRAASRELGVVR